MIPADPTAPPPPGAPAPGVPAVTMNPAGIYADPAYGPVDPINPDPSTVNRASPASPTAPPAPPGPMRGSLGGGLQPPAPPGPSGGMSYETTTTRTEGSSGLDEAAQKRANSRIDATGAAASKATDDEAVARQARAEYEVRATEQALSDVAQRRREAAAEAALNDHATAEVDRRMQAAADWKPDRKNMFGFGAGRGLAAAVAIIAGGWMQGRGQSSTNQFLPFVMKMIDEDVNDQVRTNSANIQFLREQKGDLKAAAAELKKRQLMLVDSELQAKAAAGAAKDPSVQAAIEAYKSQSAAAQAKWDGEQRTALERTVNRQVSRVTSPAAMTGPGRQSPQAIEAQSRVRQLDRVISTLEQAAEAGDLQGIVGWQDKIGANSVQDFFGGLPPGQRRAADALSELEVLNRADWKSEPNGQAVQSRLSSIGIAKNDRDIPGMLQRLKQLRADKLLDARSAPAADNPDAPVGAY